jgi:dTDP-4-dehydrorhamnose reductase
MLTGGSGLLGRELLKNDPTIYAPPRSEMDILDQRKCFRTVLAYQPDVLIHAAAYTAVDFSEDDPSRARETNIRGTLNLINACEGDGRRLVYISSDYVFDGGSAPYQSKDPINPINKYAMTKASAELAVRTMDNSLVIRASFCPNQFPHDKAFTDQFSSKDYVDIIAPLIYNECMSSKIGIVHVGTERKSVYDLAKRRKPEVGRLSIQDVSFNPPADISFKL